MLLHSQDSYTSLIPCAKITHIAAWSLLDDSSPLLLPQDTRTEQPWKVRIAQKAVKKSWCSRLVHTKMMPSVTCTSVLLWTVVEVLQQSIYMWLQFICPKKEKQNWFFMIIDCTQIRYYSSTCWSKVVVNYLIDTRKDRWENQIDNRKTYI
jgi:hypothetical protein